MQNGTTWLLKDIRNVPKLRWNLILLGQLGSDSCTISFIVDSWKVTKGALMVARGKKIGTLYLTSGIDYCNLVVADGDANL